jgi:hypothetical protein
VRIAKIIAVPAIILAATAGTLVAVAGPASAAVTGGTTTFSVPLTFVASAAKSCVTAIPQDPAEGKFNSTTNNVDITFPVTGGNANLTTLNGFVNHSGSLLFIDACTFKAVTVNNVVFDIANAAIDANQVGSSTQHVLFDLLPNINFTDTSGAVTLTADGFAMDADGASFLDSALGTTFFTANQTVGTFASNWSHS